MSKNETSTPINKYLLNLFGDNNEQKNTYFYNPEHKKKFHIVALHEYVSVRSADFYKIGDFE